MFEKTFWIRAVTPLHIGSGRGVGFIDLPVAREKVTDWPVVPGTALKGVLSAHLSRQRGHEGDSVDAREKDLVLKAAFGRTDGSNENVESSGSNGGSLLFSDGLMVCLPVRSLYGTFAWVTSPLALQRLKNRFRNGLAVPSVGKTEALTTEQSCLIGGEDRIYMEDLDICCAASETVSQWAQSIAATVFADDKDWQNLFCQRFVVIDDEIFNYLCTVGTQVDARIRIDQAKGTVGKGALWYEESIPVEALFAGVVACDRVTVKGVSAEDLKGLVSGSLSLQLGGKATVGRGQIALSFADQEV